jgi:hypothetical protein
VRVYEVPISYHGRTYAEGKKIGLKDAFRAVYCIARYGIPARARARETARRPTARAAAHGGHAQSGERVSKPS